MLFRALLVSGLGIVPASTSGLSATFLLEEGPGLGRVRGDLMTLVGTPGGGMGTFLGVALPSGSSLFPRDLLLLGKPNDLRVLFMIFLLLIKSDLELERVTATGTETRVSMKPGWLARVSWPELAGRAMSHTIIHEEDRSWRVWRPDTFTDIKHLTYIRDN